MIVPRIKTIGSMKFSSDGAVLATTRYDGFLHEDRPALLQLWAVPKGLLLWSASDPVSSLLAFSSDGRILAAIAPAGDVLLLDTGSGRIRHRIRLSDLGASVTAGAFSPTDDTLILAIEKRVAMPCAEIQMWHVGSARRIGILKGETNVVAALAISRDGHTLAVASEQRGTTGPTKTIHILNFQTGAVISSIEFDKNVWVSSMALSPGGQTLAVGLSNGGPNGEVRLWQASSGRLEKVLTSMDVGSACPISEKAIVSFSANGRVLAIDEKSQCINLWDIASGKTLGGCGQKSEEEYEDRVASQFLADGLLWAVVGRNEQAEVYLCKFPSFTKQLHDPEIR